MTTRQAPPTPSPSRYRVDIKRAKVYSAARPVMRSGARDLGATYSSNKMTRFPLLSPRLNRVHPVAPSHMNPKQAAGMVTIAHRSGGPAADIVVPLSDGRDTGFLAETPEEYAEGMARVFGCGRIAPDSASREEASGLPTGGDGGRGGFSANGGMSERGTGTGCGAVVDGFSSEAVRIAARESARRFSNEVFDREFSARFAALLQPSAGSAFSLRRGRKEE